MTSMPLDSAWRQYRGAVRDLAAQQTKTQGARNTWLTVMLEAFEERRAEAKDAGLDVNDPKALLTLGVPCADCLRIAGRNQGHKITIGGAGSQWPVYAECGRAPVNPTTDDMPTFPTTVKEKP